jgi:hypothetical protein
MQCYMEADRSSSKESGGGAMRRGLDAEYLHNYALGKSCDTLLRSDFSIQVRTLSWKTVVVIKSSFEIVMGVKCWSGERCAEIVFS